MSKVYQICINKHNPATTNWVYRVHAGDVQRSCGWCSSIYASRKFRSPDNSRSRVSILVCHIKFWNTKICTSSKEHHFLEFLSFIQACTQGSQWRLHSSQIYVMNNMITTNLNCGRRHTDTSQGSIIGIKRLTTGATLALSMYTPTCLCQALPRSLQRMPVAHTTQYTIQA